MLTQQTPLHTPAIMRSRLMLEAATELVGANEWRNRQVMILMRPQGDSQWRTRFYASDGPDSIDLVASGQADIAICNPGGVLGMAARGRGPFKTPLALRSLLVIPQFDQLGFAVTAATGLKSLGDLKRTRYPLKVSLRGQPDHSVHLVCNHVLGAYGLSLDDIASWGGEVHYTEGLPYGRDRLGAVERGEIDAVWDEALPLWAPKAIAMGMRYLPVDEPQLQALEADGLRRAAITDEEYPGLGAPVWTLDFSGWPVFCLAGAPDEMIYNFCAALDARKARVPWLGEGPLPLEQLCKDGRDGALYLPLHPGAERFWRERGYLP
ncbi:MAG TPA: TAXI family TRAP transporter solute-binding subunit [Stellaceae bacterium]|nr:TAXI family TRAP transporter solute-binding subunit [Stellaceae bacterium]